VKGLRPADAALLEARARTQAATWRRVQRAVDGDVRSWWSPSERTLLHGVPKGDLDAPLVALAGELEDLVALEARWDDRGRGEPKALDDVVSALLDDHALALMPHGRLPPDPAPAVRRVLDRIKEELVARLVLQWAVDGASAPTKPGAIDLHLFQAPSWGASPRAIVLGRARAVLASATPLPQRFRFTWDRRGFALSSVGARPPVRLGGTWGAREWQIHAPARRLEPVLMAGPWPLLPPIVEAGARPNPASLLAATPAKVQVQRIERALAVLEAAWPDGARTVRAFTRVLIPVTQPEVVSYSFAPVPGWSYINLYHRDFVDLIDDLVHENAHHHLNHLISRTALYRTTDDNLVYYSPWRETLRPLRGILHSVFTFSRGAELFSRLWRALESSRPLPHRFDRRQRQKIAARCLEETLQVRYSLVDLAHAGRAGQLTTAGRVLVRALERESTVRRDLEPTLARAIRGTRAAHKLATLSHTLEERRGQTARVDRGAR
jgi:HEXXH motif-containing protein